MLSFCVFVFVYDDAIFQMIMKDGEKIVNNMWLLREEVVVVVVGIRSHRPLLNTNHH